MFYSIACGYHFVDSHRKKNYSFEFRCHAILPIPMYQTPLESKRKNQELFVQDITELIAHHCMSHATRRRPILRDETVRKLTTPAVNTSWFLLLVLPYMSTSDLLESLRTKTLSRRDISGFHGGEGTELYFVRYDTVSRAGGYRHIEGMCLQTARKQSVPPKLG